MKLPTVNVVRLYFTDKPAKDIDEKWNLKQLQDFVGGYVEAIPSSVPNRSLYVNEDGLSLNLPQNIEATQVIYPGTFVLGFIRGNAILVKS